MKKAFTLAEVLVTLGIIGVVAAMTMPNLMSNYQRQSYVTQLRKIHSELSQAVEAAMNDSNNSKIDEVAPIRQGTLLEKYFKTLQICTVNDLTNCFASEYKNLNGSVIRLRDYISETSSCAIVASGYSICFSRRRYFIVDVNGQQGPNIYGRDLFSLYIDNNGMITSNINPGVASVENCKNAQYGECFAKILNDGWVMDY